MEKALVLKNAEKSSPGCDLHWKIMIDAGKTKDENLAETFDEFRQSFRFDQRLFAADIRICLVYCDALFHAGVITRAESERIRSGLQTILKRADFNRSYFQDAATQDVHAFIETRLVGLIGEAGEKLRVGRSAEEQTATAVRLWLREEIEAISNSARDLQTALIDAGERQKTIILPANANRHKTSPILWAHWCLAYFEMLARDRERLDEVWRRVNVLPLGAATSFEIDREEIARQLSFEGVSANSLDSISDADFAAEFLAGCSLLMVHLSRLAEDLSLYDSAEINLIELSGALQSEAFSPKKNSDVLELVRAKSSRIFGHQTALLSMSKSLPLGIHKDLQETQEAIFDSVDTVKSCLKIMRIFAENIRVIESRTLESIKGNANADELTDYLIHREVPPKVAEDTTKKIISCADSKGRELSELSLEELQQFSEKIREDVFGALSLEQILASKNQIGGTAPERVFEALEAARASLEREGKR